MAILSKYSKYDFFVFVTMCLSSLVFIEPAPYDLLMIILVLISGPQILKDFRESKFKIAYYAFSGFAFMNILSMVNHVDLMAGIRYGFITFYLMGSCLWVKSYVKNEDKAEIILKGSIVASILALTLGLLDSFGVKLTHIPNVMFDDGFRIRGTFKDPNVFGPFLLTPLFLIYSIMRTRKDYFVSIVALVLQMGVVLSLSRGAWVSYAVSLVMFSILTMIGMRHVPLRRTISFALLTLFTCLLILQGTGRTGIFLSRFGFMNYDQDRFLNQVAAITGNEKYEKELKYVGEPNKDKVDIVAMEVEKLSKKGNETTVNNASDEPGKGEAQKQETKTEGSDDSKQQGLAKNGNGKGSIDHTRKYFLKTIIGIGPGQFESNYPMSAHSLYVRALSENGFIGIVFLLAFVGLISYRLYLNRRDEMLAWVSPVVVLALLAGIMVNGIVIDTIHWRHFWILLGLGWAIVDYKVESWSQ